MDFQRNIHTIAKILAKDLHAVENKEMVYKQLKLAPADLIPLKLKFAAEHNVYNFFSDTLQKWHGGLGTSATVELFLDELKNMDISELEGCIQTIRLQLGLPLPSAPTLAAPAVTGQSHGVSTTGVSFDFLLSRIQANKITDIIADEHEHALRQWGDIKEEFLTKGSDILKVDELLKDGKSKEAIRLTLSTWIENSGTSGTFAAMTAILRRKNCKNLADKLEKRVLEIQGVTLQDPLTNK